MLIQISISRSAFSFQCQVSSKLRKLADKKGADKERYNHLANTVDAFTSFLLDPLRSDQVLREEFGALVLDDIIDDAIDLDQKKVFLNCGNKRARSKVWVKK